MITILKNNLQRTLAKPALFIPVIILTAGAIGAALFFSARGESTANIAYIAAEAPGLPVTDSLDITVLPDAPAYSALISGTYDAIVIPEPDGSWDIRTVKGDALKYRIVEFLETGTIAETTDDAVRGPGATILSFLLMFLLMQSSTLMCMLGEDKEHKQITRIASSPLSITGYLAAHSLFNFLFIFTSAMGILYTIKFMTGIDIGFSFGQYCLLTALICAVGTSFSLFLNALFSKSDNANMTGASVLVITTVLSGSFFAFDKDNHTLGSIIRFLPQKVCLNIIENMEQGRAFSDSVRYFVYLAVLILLLMGIAVIKTRSDYVRN